MKVMRSIAEVRRERARLGKLAFVPTMGALHAGHMSLVRIAREHAPHVAVSIFVNPTQFGPREDFARYPRPIESDLRQCQEAGVDLVFHPEVHEMYRPGLPDIVIELPGLTSVLEGAKRPGHFKGVCQIVAKLFHILTPEVACFGMKDYQQLRIITAMVEALDWGIQIIPCPTVREPDGLAMSSRNAYLSAEERQRALAIYRALCSAQQQVKAGYRAANRLITTMQNILLEQRLLVDYAAVVDPMTLQSLPEVQGPALLAIAARVGSTRLIDNMIVSAS